MKIGTMRVEEARAFNAMQGFHKFIIRHDDAPNETWGSFEVFFHDGKPTPEQATGDDATEVLKGGWYWWPCYPGCLPDGEPTGPFLTSQRAFDSAIGDGAEDSE